MSVGCNITLNWERPHKELVDSFCGIQVANLDDCMNRTAAISGMIRPLNKSPLCGTAFTVRVAPGDNLFFHKAMDLAKPGDVFMIDAGGDVSHAIFGEIMVTYCRLRGVRGIVLDGAVRDYSALSKLEDFAVYAKGITPNGPYKNGPGEIGTTIQIGGQIVRPGDIVVGDEDGVIIIKPEDAAVILEQARNVQKKEQETIRMMVEEQSYPRAWVDEKLRAICCNVQ